MNAREVNSLVSRSLEPAARRDVVVDVVAWVVLAVVITGVADFGYLVATQLPH
jgi:hypothetical protein